MTQFRSLVFGILMVVGVISSASPPSRISSQVLDLSSPHQIRIAPGLVTVLEFPDPITEVRVGLPESLKALISSVNANELTLYLAEAGGRPTNVIVRSGRRVFVFDVNPSVGTHQDFVRIRGSRVGLRSMESESTSEFPKRTSGKVIESVKIGEGR